MFKLGVITDEISQDFGRAVEIAKKNNLDFVEIRSVWDKPPHQLISPDIRKMKDILTKVNLQITCVASPVFKCHIEQENEYQEHLEILKQCIELVHQVNTNILRIFTFRKPDYAKASSDKKENIALDQNWSLLIDRFKPVIELAKKEQVKLAIENEHSCLVGTGKELNRFLDALEAVLSPKSQVKSLSPEVNHFGKDLGLRTDFPVFALWDPCNEIFDGVTEPPYPIGYEAIANQMIHMHIKDAIRENPKSQIPNSKIDPQSATRNPQLKLPQGGKPKCVPIGDGWIDWVGQFRALIKSNYTGGVSLETHWRPDYANPESVRASSGVPDLTRPGGNAFSSLGEEASQFCLDRIFAILRILKKQS